MHKVARRLAKTFSKEYFCPKVRAFCPYMYLNKISEFFFPNLRLDYSICYALQIFITLYWKVDSIKVIRWTSSNIPCIPRCVIFIEIVISTYIIKHFLLNNDLSFSHKNWASHKMHLTCMHSRTMILNTVYLLISFSK